MFKLPLILLPITLALGTSLEARAGLDFNEICSDVLSVADQIGKTGDQNDLIAGQKLQYCRAAKDSKSAASQNGMLWKVWAGVAGVCTTACVTSFFGQAHLGMVCTGSNIGAGVTDSVMTKNFMSGLSAIGTTLMGKAANSALNHGKEAKEGGKKAAQKDWAACLSAANAAMQSMGKKSSEKSAKAAMEGNLKSAAELGKVTITPETKKVQITTNNTPGARTNVFSGGPVGTRTIIGGQGFQSDDSSGDRAKSRKDQCDSPSSSSSVIACSMAKDSSLPGFISKTQFNDEIEKATGGSLAEFVGRAKDPASAIAAASGSLGSPAVGQVAALAEAAAGALGNGDTAAEATYAAGGAPSGGGVHDDGADPGLAQVMAKLLGPKPGEEGKEDPRDVRFKPSNALPPGLRGPASADDRSFSLFDRITYRYYFVGKRILYEED